MVSVSPVVKAEMLIRRPAHEVFEAFVDPAVTSKFWFTKGSERLQAGTTVLWEWEMYGVSDEVFVREVRPNERLLVESSDGTSIEWTFEARGDRSTFVTIKNSGFAGTEEGVVGQALDAMGGYTMVLCGCKAYLEHGIALQLVADRAPDGHVER